jgi:hypothetical protein
LFKIPAHARFCERTIRTALADADLAPEALWVAPDRIHLLVAAPAAFPREKLAPALKRFVEQALRASGALGRGIGPLWDDRAWCAVLTHARGVAAVRRRLSRGALPSVSLGQSEQVGRRSTIVMLSPAEVSGPGSGRRGRAAGPR